MKKQQISIIIKNKIKIVSLSKAKHNLILQMVAFKTFVKCSAYHKSDILKLIQKAIIKFNNY